MNGRQESPPTDQGKSDIDFNIIRRESTTQHGQPFVNARHKIHPHMGLEIILTSNTDRLGFARWLWLMMSKKEFNHCLMSIPTYRSTLVIT